MFNQEPKLQIGWETNKHLTLNDVDTLLMLKESLRNRMNTKRKKEIRYDAYILGLLRTKQQTH